MAYFCPACRGPLLENLAAFHCAACARDFPVIAGIPDFRLWPDPYIGMEADRAKAMRLAAAANERDFASLVRYYYSITPEHPADLAAHRIAHTFVEPEIARFHLDLCAFPVEGRILDLGCSTAGLLVAAAAPSRELTGVDVALRWLVVAQSRLREAGVAARLVCANAEALPFPPQSFQLQTWMDVLEHLRDPRQAAAEARRVAAPGARLLLAANNRYSLLPDPYVHLWGVGWLPRAWQKRYVRFRRRDLLPYEVKMLSPGESGLIFREAGFADVQLAPAPLTAPHRPALAAALAAYNRALPSPLLNSAARSLGPRFLLTATAALGMD